MNNLNKWSVAAFGAVLFCTSTVFADAASQRSESLSRVEITSHDKQSITCSLHKGSIKLVNLTVSKGKPRARNFSAPSPVKYKKIALRCSKGSNKRMVKTIPTMNLGKQKIIVTCLNASRIQCTYKTVWDLPPSGNTSNGQSSHNNTSTPSNHQSNTSHSSSHSNRTSGSNRSNNRNTNSSNRDATSNNSSTSNQSNTSNHTSSSNTSSNTENAPYKRVKIRFGNAKSASSTCTIKTKKGKVLAKMTQRKKSAKTYSIRISKKDYGYLDGSCKSGGKKVSWRNKFNTKNFKGDKYVSVKCKASKKLDCKMVSKPMNQLANEEKENMNDATDQSPQQSNEGVLVTFSLKNSINKPVVCTLKAGSTTFTTLNVPARDQSGVSKQLYIPTDISSFKLTCTAQNQSSRAFTIQTRKLLEGAATRIEGTCYHGPSCSAQLK